MRRALLPLIPVLMGLTALSSITGCSEKLAVRVIPERTVYTQGQTLSAQFVNNSEDPIGYGACSLHLERKVGATWVSVNPSTGTCIGNLYTLEAGQERELRVPLEEDLAPGAYRLRQDILPRTSLPERSVYSPDFQVQRAG